MTYKELKGELFQTKKAFVIYKKGFAYLFSKFFFAKKILKVNRGMDKEITSTEFSTHILTPHKHMVMACWALVSFYKTHTIIGQLYIHNDGSLQDRDKKILKELFSRAIIVEPEEAAHSLYKLDEYPELQKIYNENKNLWMIKKLFDPFLISYAKYRLIIDTDIIWFKDPEEIKQAVEKASNDSLMTHTTHARGYIKFKDGQTLDDETAAYNSGIVFYDEKNFNLKKLSDYFKKVDMHDKDKMHWWFMEQAGYASCLDNLKKLPLEKYHVKNGVNDTTVARHYTGPRRVLFYIEGVEKIKKVCI